MSHSIAGEEVFASQLFFQKVRMQFYMHHRDEFWLQAFTLRVRPAVDDLESVVDRTKMSIYKTFARLGLPCPITGSPASIGKEAIKTEQQTTS